MTPNISLDCLLSEKLVGKCKYPPKFIPIVSLTIKNCFSDLTSVGKLEQDIIQSFSAVSEEIKSAASYALGSICIGNLPYYLPFILNEIQNQPKRQYLLLHSLKEVSN